MSHIASLVPETKLTFILDSWVKLGEKLLRSQLKRAVYLVNNTSTASWMFLWGGVLGMSSQEESLRHTLDRLAVDFVHLATKCSQRG